MDANRAKKIGIGGTHHRCHGTSGRESGHEYAVRIDSVFGDDFVGDSSNDGRLTATVRLMLGAKPVPAQGCVCGFGLGRLGHDESMLLGKSVHARTCGEVVGVLCAPMQHDKQGTSACLRVPRNIKLVLSTTGRAGKEPA